MVETPWLKNYEDGVPPSLVYPEGPPDPFLAGVCRIIPPECSHDLRRKEILLPGTPGEGQCPGQGLNRVGGEKGGTGGLAPPQQPSLRCRILCHPESGRDCRQPEPPGGRAGDPPFPETCGSPDDHRGRTALLRASPKLLPRVPWKIFWWPACGSGRR